MTLAEMDYILGKLEAELVTREEKRLRDMATDPIFHTTDAIEQAVKMLRHKLGR